MNDPRRHRPPRKPSSNIDLDSSGAHSADQIQTLLSRGKKLEESGQIPPGSTGRVKRPKSVKKIEDHDLLGSADKTLEANGITMDNRTVYETLKSKLKEGLLMPTKFRGALRGIVGNFLSSSGEFSAEEMAAMDQLQSDIQREIDDIEMQFTALKIIMKRSKLTELPQIKSELDRLAAILQERISTSPDQASKADLLILEEIKDYIKLMGRTAASFERGQEKPEDRIKHGIVDGEAEDFFGEYPI